MSPSKNNKAESKVAIFTAFIANIGIGISKFIAFLLTASSSMLAEAVHSIVDSSNQIFLLIGVKQSKKAPTIKHPFGYGRVHFFYAFLISIMLFSLGGLFAIYEGLNKIQNPHEIKYPLIAFVVLFIAIMLEGTALRTALREVQSFKQKTQGWWQFLRQTKSVNHVVLMLEDSAALIGLSMAIAGVTMTLLTDNPLWDGISTLLIGTLLVFVAIILFREVKSLLIGESVDIDQENKMRELILSVNGVDRIVDLKTLFIGPTDLLITMKVTVGAEDKAKIIAQTIDQIEALLRHNFPIANLIYIEPDLYKTKKQQKISDSKIEDMISTSNS